jgi:hypothetical protein
MAQILQPYRVPIVYDDLTEEETLQDVFYALDNLSGTIKDIFNTDSLKLLIAVRNIKDNLLYISNKGYVRSRKLSSSNNSTHISRPLQLLASPHAHW